MKITTCQARNLAELMSIIRDTYGQDAALLSVRRLDSSTPGAKPVIEGTVGYEPRSAESQNGPATAANEKSKGLGLRDVLRRVLPSNEQAAPRRAGKLAPKVIALVGPMGAGKTTTAAKLAGYLANLNNEPAGVISTDTHRPGGSALLLAYAAELGLHGTTAITAPDLQNRIARWNCRGPLVVDTRGCSPRDSWTLESLGKLLDTAHVPMERYLVLSATEHPAVARECLIAYSTLGISSVVLTRVDQAAGIGHCLSEVRRHKLPIPYIGTGESVPDDLLEPSSDSLRGLELAEQKLA